MQYTVMFVDFEDPNKKDDTSDQMAKSKIVEAAKLHDDAASEKYGDLLKPVNTWPNCKEENFD